MRPSLLVVARASSALNKFAPTSLQEAFNLRDFLEQTGEFEEVSIFQLLSETGPMKEWVKLGELEC